MPFDFLAIFIKYQDISEAEIFSISMVLAIYLRVDRDNQFCTMCWHFCGGLSHEMNLVNCIKHTKQPRLTADHSLCLHI